MPPIAKPQYLAQLLRHMASLENKTPRHILEKMGPMWDETRKIVDVMSPEKLGEARFATLDEATRIRNRYGVSAQSGFAATPQHDPAGIMKDYINVMPLYNFENRGVDVIAHEPRHTQQQKGIYNKLILSGDEVLFNNNPLEQPIKTGIPKNYFADIHHIINATEIDAFLSAHATLEAAKLRHKHPLDEYWMNKIWDESPEFVKKHYRKTIGVAAPAIGAFQPETQE